MATKSNGGNTTVNIEPPDIDPGTSEQNTVSFGDDRIPVVDPERVTEQATASEPVKRGRGRPKGTGGNTNAKAGKQKANDLTALLVSAHFMMSQFAGIEELQIDKSEAEMLSNAMNEVNEYYGGVIMPEWMRVWSGFAMAAGAVYGPRAMAFQIRLRKERAEGKTKEKRPVTINAVM